MQQTKLVTYGFSFLHGVEAAELVTWICDQGFHLIDAAFDVTDHRDPSKGVRSLNAIIISTQISYCDQNPWFFFSLNNKWNSWFLFFPRARHFSYREKAEKKKKYRWLYKVSRFLCVAQGEQAAEKKNTTKQNLSHHWCLRKAPANLRPALHTRLFKIQWRWLWRNCVLVSLSYSSKWIYSRAKMYISRK